MHDVAWVALSLVEHIGGKTLRALLAHFDSMDDLYQRLDEVAAIEVRGAKTLAQKLIDSKEAAFMSRELSRIECNVPIQSEREQLLRRKPDMDEIARLYDQADFGHTLRRQAERIAAAA